MHGETAKFIFLYFFRDNRLSSECIQLLDDDDDDKNKNDNVSHVSTCIT